MKFLKHLVLVALVVGGLFLPLTATRPQSASAAPPDACYLLSSLFALGFAETCPEGRDAIFETCLAANLDVSATADGNSNSYKYDLICDRNIPATPPTIHVNGVYSFDTKVASERLRTDELLITANWICPHDPWIAPSPVSCSISGEVDLTHVGIDGSFNITNQTYNVQNGDINHIGYPRNGPLSVRFLNNDARLVLFQAQLRYTAAQAAKAEAIRKVLQPSAITTAACVTCSAVGTTPAPAPVPTLPDLKVATLGGDTTLAQGVSSIYSIGVSNLGTRPGTQVQVSIQVTGALAYVATAQTPAGWDCSGTAPVLCVGPLGGSGDSVQQLAVGIGVQVRGAKAGIGAVSASVDPNGLIAESDETNNGKTLAVTVK